MDVRRWRRRRRRCRCVVLLCEVQSSYWMALDQANKQSGQASKLANQLVNQCCPRAEPNNRASNSSATLSHAHIDCCCCCRLWVFRFAFSVALWKAARRATPAAAWERACGNAATKPKPATSHGATAPGSRLLAPGSYIIVRHWADRTAPFQPILTHWQLNYFSARQTKEAAGLCRLLVS